MIMKKVEEAFKWLFTDYLEDNLENLSIFVDIAKAIVLLILVVILMITIILPSSILKAPFYLLNKLVGKLRSREETVSNT